MTKEQLALKIARENHEGKSKLESFHDLQCIRSYFYDLCMDDLEGIAGQYGINIYKGNSELPLTTEATFITIHRTIVNEAFPSKGKELSD